MHIKESEYKQPKVEFVLSAPDLSLCPDLGGKPEFALIGRSNVGKSSFINRLTRRKRIAHTSNTPGKTRLLNYYLVNETWVLVDLPGYGFAKVAKSEQQRWRKVLEQFLSERKPLIGAVQLIDSRHGPQKNDIEMNRWLAEAGIEVAVILTKLDKIKKSQKSKVLKASKEGLIAEKGYFFFSADTAEGAGAVWHALRDWRQAAPGPA